MKDPVENIILQILQKHKNAFNPKKVVSSMTSTLLCCIVYDLCIVYAKLCNAGFTHWHCSSACLFVTRHMLVWKGILVAVFFLRPVTDVSATVAPISVKICIMVHVGPRWIFSPLGAVTRDPQVRNFGRLTANISKTVTCSIACQLQLNISSTRAF